MLNKNAFLVVAHKPFDIQSDDQAYIGIAVGNEKETVISKWRDDIGENISEKNYCFCELTALYWFWKNEMKNYDVVALCHYRRYFSSNYINMLLRRSIRSKDVEKLLSNDNTIILPIPFYWNTTVEKMYYEVGDGKEKDLLLLKNVVSQLYPDYISSLNLVLKNKSASYCNMFIMKSSMADEYCNWLFNILLEMEKHLDMSEYTTQERRVYGYLGEILLNVWVKNKGIRVKYYPMMNTNYSPIRALKEIVANFRNKYFI